MQGRVCERLWKTRLVVAGVSQKGAGNEIGSSIARKLQWCTTMSLTARTKAISQHLAALVPSFAARTYRASQCDWAGANAITGDWSSKSAMGRIGSNWEDARKVAEWQISIEQLKQQHFFQDLREGGHVSLANEGP